MEAIVGTFLILLAVVTFVVLNALVGHKDEKNEKSWHLDPAEALGKAFSIDRKNDYKKSVPKQGFKPKKTRRSEYGSISYGHLSRGCRWFSV